MGLVPQFLECQLTASQPSNLPPGIAQPHCAGLGRLLSLRSIRAAHDGSALLPCHASPVRNARLPSVSDKTRLRFAAAGLLPSLRSIRAAHDGSALLPCHARAGRMAGSLSLRLKQNPVPLRGPWAFAFAPLQAPLCACPRASSKKSAASAALFRAQRRITRRTRS